jgi:ABC-type molybdate transport system ATPase subunit
VESVSATVVGITRLGFETRIALDADGQELWAQVTTEVADRLELRPGSSIYVRHRGRTVPVSA